MTFQTIREIPNNLSRSFCDHLIKKFENSPHKVQGTIGSRRRVDKSIKNSIDYAFSHDKEWQLENNIIQSKLYDVVDPWMREHYKLTNLPWPNGILSSSGFQIQKTVPGKVGYRWHSDEHYHRDNVTGIIQRRYITYLWYLNDCEEGYTEFLDRQIIPECGKLLLFFADPCMIHRGVPPKTGSKYIMTGWVSCQIDVVDRVL